MVLKAKKKKKQLFKSNHLCVLSLGRPLNSFHLQISKKKKKSPGSEEKQKIPPKKVGAWDDPSHREAVWPWLNAGAFPCQRA